MGRKPMNGTCRALVSLALLLMTSAVIAAETTYYTWVDENGITNYAERLPRGYEEKVRGSQPVEAENEAVDEALNAGRPGRRPVAVAPAEAPADTEAEEADTGAEVDPDELIREEREKIQAELAEERRFNCDVGKRNLTRLEAFSRIRIADEATGEQRFMTPAEVEQKKAESRQLIRDNCRG